MYAIDVCKAKAVSWCRTGVDDDWKSFDAFLDDNRLTERHNPLRFQTSPARSGDPFAVTNPKGLGTAPIR